MRPKADEFAAFNEKRPDSTKTNTRECPSTGQAEPHNGAIPSPPAGKQGQLFPKRFTSKGHPVTIQTNLFKSSKDLAAPFGTLSSWPRHHPPFPPTLSRLPEVSPTFHRPFHGGPEPCQHSADLFTAERTLANFPPTFSRSPGTLPTFRRLIHGRPEPCQLSADHFTAARSLAHFPPTSSWLP